MLFRLYKARKFEGVSKCNGQKFNHRFTVVDGSRSNLLGHNILSSTLTNWLQLLKVQQVDNVNRIFNKLCQEFSDVFGVGVTYEERDRSRH